MLDTACARWLSARNAASCGRHLSASTTCGRVGVLTQSVSVTARFWWPTASWSACKTMQQRSCLHICINIAIHRAALRGTMLLVQAGRTRSLKSARERTPPRAKASISFATAGSSDADDAPPAATSHSKLLSNECHPALYACRSTISGCSCSC